MVGLYLRGRVDNGDLYRHTVGSWEEWVSLGNS